MYLHPEVEAIEIARRANRVTVKELAVLSGIERQRLARVLDGITTDEMAALRRACRALKIRVPRA